MIPPERESLANWQLGNLANCWNVGCDPVGGRIKSFLRPLQGQIHIENRYFYVLRPRSGSDMHTWFDPTGSRNCRGRRVPCRRPYAGTGGYDPAGAGNLWHIGNLAIWRIVGTSATLRGQGISGAQGPLQETLRRYIHGGEIRYFYVLRPRSGSMNTFRTIRSAPQCLCGKNHRGLGISSAPWSNLRFDATAAPRTPRPPRLNPSRPRHLFCVPCVLCGWNPSRQGIQHSQLRIDFINSSAVSSLSHAPHARQNLSERSFCGLRLDSKLRSSTRMIAFLVEALSPSIRSTYVFSQGSLKLSAFISPNISHSVYWR